MSYTIVYDRQVIKTPTGYSLVVLDGDNNVWENNRRRARDWNCWLLNKSETEFDAFFNGMTGGKYQEHFKYNGKWVDDAALLRWYKKGLRNARTIEEYAEAVGCVHCKLLVYSEEQNAKEELSQYIKTTDRFLEWIEEVEQRKQKGTTERFYVVISFNHGEPLRLPGEPTQFHGKVYLTYKSKYVYEIDERGWTYGDNCKKAMIFNSVQEAKKAAEQHRNRRFAYHDAERFLKKIGSQNYVIALISHGIKSYIRKKTARRYLTTYSPEFAKHFTMSEAKRYAASINPADKTIRVEIEEHHLN